MEIHVNMKLIDSDNKLKKEIYYYRDAYGEEKIN